MAIAELPLRLTPPEARSATPGDSRLVGTREASWDALEQLVSDLQGCREAVTSGLRSLLRAVRAGVRADLVFLFDTGKGDVLGADGCPGVSSRWCRDWAAQLLQTDSPKGSR